MPLTAKDVMTTEMITVTPATPIAEFARICAEDNISGTPVVRVDGTLVGIVSKTDLIQRVLDAPSYAGTGSFPTWDDNQLAIEDIMNGDVLTVAPDTPLPEIASRMAADRIHRVLVMDGDKLVGIVTSIDLLAHFPE